MGQLRQKMMEDMQLLHRRTHRDASIHSQGFDPAYGFLCSISTITGLILFMLTVLFVQSGIAATVDGHAYKDGATDHSKITIDLEALPPIPTIGGAGLILILAGFREGMRHRGSNRVKSFERQRVSRLFLESSLFVFIFSAYDSKSRSYIMKMGWLDNPWT